MSKFTPEEIAYFQNQRFGSTKHPGYFSLTPRSLTDFDWLVILDSTAYSRGMPPLSDVGTDSTQ